MRNAEIVKRQAEAISEIAKMLHVQRQSVVVLFVSEHHPLPMPPRRRNDDFFVINRQYIQQLRGWVSEEMDNPDHQLTEALDFEKVQKELQSAEKGLATYDFIEVYPPGYFLG